MLRTDVIRAEALDGTRLALHSFGGSGEPVLLLPGLTAHGRQLDAIAEGLLPDHRVFSLDFRGRGLSDAPAAASLAIHADDVLAVLRHLGDRVHLVGHSMGGIVAVIAAGGEHGARGRIARLVLIDGAGDVPPENLRGIEASLQRLSQVLPSAEAYLETMRSAPHLQPWNAYLQAFAEGDLLLLPDGRARSRLDPELLLGEMRRNAELGPLRRYQEGIGVPTLILRATDPVLPGTSPVFSSEAALEALGRIRGSRLREFPGTHHYSITMQPNPGLIQAIREFLEPI